VRDTDFVFLFYWRLSI